MGGLVNLTNHPLETWPATQRERALAQWGAVLELSAGATLVDIASDEEAVVRQAQALVDESRRRGATAALVAGELRLTLALVALLQAAGVACVTTVSERHVEETPQPDGTMRTLRTYRFAGFRRVPDLAPLLRRSVP